MIETSANHNAEIIPRMRRVFWIGTICLLSVAVTVSFFYWLNTRSNQWVAQSQVIGRIARESRSLALDREAGIQGYILSGEAISLTPELRAREALKSMLDSLLALTRDNASQQDRAKAITLAVDRWDRGWARQVLTVGHVPAVETDLAGKELFDSIRAAFDSFLAGQQRIQDRVVAMQSALQMSTLIAVFLEISLLLGVFIWLSRRATAQASELIEKHEQLETQTLDLQQQAAELEEQAIELEEQTNEVTETANSLLESNRRFEETIEMLQNAESNADRVTTQNNETRDLLDFVLNSSPVGVSVRDSNLQLVRVNAALEAMTGMSSAELEGKSVDQIMSDDIAEVMERALRQVITTGKPMTNIPISGATRCEPDRVRHYLASFFPVKLSGGTTGVGTVVLETTQYRQLEDQLRQAQKMEAVGRLAGGIAHDFNNMLTAIMSYSELLLADMPADSTQRPDVLEILKAGEKATALTRKLLAFSRQQVLRPTTVNLNETVDGLKKMLRQLTSENIDLICNLAPDVWTVNADATEIERVIMNLVLNSRDAMPDGGRVIIETANVDIDEEYSGSHADTIPGAYVMIAVSDTGAGMSREVREKLFDPFFTTKEKGKGTGLGLASVYGIVKQSGGFIWVYSEPGHGTTFKVYLPRAEESLANITQPPRRNHRVGAETILLVEDDDEVRNVATRILRNNGYRVLEAANGTEALRVCEGEHVAVDLIVTDIVMPEMGGTELAGRLRENQPDARILFTSGYTEDAAIRQSFLDPGEEFIEKPFTPASLALKARQMLDASKRS